MDNFCLHGRDRPLDFQHQLDAVALEALVLPETKNKSSAIACASMLAEAILVDEAAAVGSCLLRVEPGLPETATS